MIRPRHACALAAAWLALLAAVRADTPAFSPDSARSASGQFVVTFTPETTRYYRRPETTNMEYLRLEAPWLAVSAERFKAVLWRELGLPAGSPWSGKIFIALHPARSLDEPAIIAPQPFVQTWNCRLELPDRIHRDRYARALCAVILLEIADRNAPVSGRPAEIPSWFVDGLARQVAESDETGIILSAPSKTVDGIAQTRVNQKFRGLDPLASARHVLQNYPALTFDQLSWPEDAQLNGDDGGVYLASAQLFVDELLDLKNGPEKMRVMLSALPSCQNWQSAFFAAFRENFSSPLDVEKWWSLRVVAFAAHVPGPQWSMPVSRDKLNALLLVPVEIRQSPDALPTREDISLQSAIRSINPPQQNEILRIKMRDLELAQFRLIPPLAAVAGEYHRALTDFLGDGVHKRKIGVRHEPLHTAKADAARLLKKLDALDVHRRAVEAQLESKTLPLPGQNQ
jgi:hypothetical protein